MSKLLLEKVILQALKELESSGDIIVTTSVPNEVVNKLVTSVRAVSLNLLCTEEYSAIINAANLTWSGFQVDDYDFHTHVGLTRDELGKVLKKIGNPI